MSAPRYWGVVPAAGVGRRMGSDIPKQYLPLAGSTVLEETIGRLLTLPRLSGICVALGEADTWWPATRYAQDARVWRVDGGAERCHSVLNALNRLTQEGDDNDWVLVHDAARPCVRKSDIEQLIDTLAGDPVGGLLGMRVRDTMKRTGEDGRIVETVSRNGLWHAFTPQMFRLGVLREALSGALAAGILVTDEASAMEWAGHAPRMVEGHSDNLKITQSQDLSLAGFFLEQQRLAVSE